MMGRLELRTYLLLCSFAALCLGSCADNNRFQLFKLNTTQASQYAARCIDGSPFGYWYSNCATGAQSKKLVIYLEGGGYCVPASTNPAAMQDCKVRQNTPYGSSKNWQGQRGPPKDILSYNTSINPDFADWSFIYVPYCSGDLYTGTRNTTYNNTNQYQSGHNNLKSIIATIPQTFGWEWSEFTDIIISGDSAGGFGAHLNAKLWKTSAPDSNIVLYPEAGWFVSTTPYPGSNTVDSVTAIRTIAAAADSYVNPDCTAAVYQNQFPAAWDCFAPNVSFPYWGMKAFIAEYIFDSNQIITQNGVPLEFGQVPAESCDYIEDFGKIMKASLEVLMTQQGASSGLFAPSCTEHSFYSWNDRKIDGVSLQQLFGDWYFQRSNSAFSNYKAIDPCFTADGGVGCNPTCQNTFKVDNCFNSAEKIIASFMMMAFIAIFCL